ncbi:MAG: YqaA family protein [Candidatus Gastranaerophilaceae bacterium]
MHNLLDFNAMVAYFQQFGTWGLALNSFVESFFLVPPPDFLLIIMDLAKPEKALWYATVCSIASILGGLIGYLIGFVGGRPVFNWFFRKNPEQFEKVEELYNKYGSIAVFFAGFTPIPYKVFTIASGVLGMNVWQFIVASFFGRAGRFFIVSVVLMLFGEMIKQYIELVIAVVSLIIVVFFVILYFKGKHSMKNAQATENSEEKTDTSDNDSAIHNA